MGDCVAPDIFQETMNKLLDDLEYVSAYIDNFLILQNQDEIDENHHCKLSTVLKRLEDTGFRANLKNPSSRRPKSTTLDISSQREELNLNQKRGSDEAYASSEILQAIEDISGYG